MKYRIEIEANPADFGLSLLSAANANARADGCAKVSIYRGETLLYQSAHQTKLLASPFDAVDAALAGMQHCAKGPVV